MISVQRLNFVLWLLLSVSFLGETVRGENIDAEEVDRFCYPDLLRNSRLSCECSSVNAAPWGMRALHIDCSYKDYKSKDLSELLPLYIDSLDLSWNTLDLVPQFSSDTLRQLNLMHNNISGITSNNFAQLGSLQELHLSWNSIQWLAAQAFANLPHLQVLDLGHNNLQVLPAQIFAPLLVLTTLDLAWNRQLNQTVELQAKDWYNSYGINNKLGTLRLDACNLSTLVLPTAAPLKHLSLRRNRFTRVPPQLPATLQQLDMSDNLLEILLPTDLGNLTQLQQLTMEDMPVLESIAANALQSLDMLEVVSLQNSRRLSSINDVAFGSNKSYWPPLRRLIFRGTMLRTFNATLYPLFAQLDELDLNGLPLHCYCELVWLKDLTIETNGRCYKPSSVRGMLVSSVRRDYFKCDSWPRWLYGLMVLGLISLMAAGAYLVVMGLRPHRGVTMRRKVGAGSPYARVTIEPNRQENNFSAVD
ncbi:phospholipase A2 inhibitor [Scaptodrosophila lebanonensis]|uniref:Phospholipase A2 inhibitor n=1 Tax=Drosophila lebanonensis TaxID=7225 RepID=A0A6J2TLM2_DROLE|nr:phospholipase A2 inhibitor [Scaptodrosophila lebanonensis]